MIRLLMTYLSNEPYFIDAIGLKEHLSPTRANGLLSMVKQIKLACPWLINQKMDRFWNFAVKFH